MLREGGSQNSRREGWISGSPWPRGGALTVSDLRGDLGGGGVGNKGFWLT